MFHSSLKHRFTGCYSAATLLRSTPQLSGASTAAQPSVEADGGQVHPLAAAHTSYGLAAQNDNSVSTLVGAVCATLGNILETGAAP